MCIRVRRIGLYENYVTFMKVTVVDHEASSRSIRGKVRVGVGLIQLCATGGFGLGCLYKLTHDVLQAQ